MADEDPALAEIERLADELYKAEDALAFVAECCDVADSVGGPLTTADVRRWLEGAKCGRQMLAEQAQRSPADTVTVFHADLDTVMNRAACIDGWTDFADACDRIRDAINGGNRD